MRKERKSERKRNAAPLPDVSPRWCHMKEKWFRSRCFLFLHMSRGFHPHFGSVGGTEAKGKVN